MSSGSPAPPWRRVSSLPRIVPTVRLMLRIGSSSATGSPRSRAGMQRGNKRRHVERRLDPMLLVAHLADGDAGARVGPVEDLAEIEPSGLVMVDGLLRVEQLAAADHVVDRAEAKLRHQLAHFLGDELEEVDHVLGLAAETSRAIAGSGWRCRPGRYRGGRRASSRSPSPPGALSRSRIPRHPGARRSRRRGRSSTGRRSGR